jgi:glycosyltransferase involved in cell wall biosynthesis
MEQEGDGGSMTEFTTADTSRNGTGDDVRYRPLSATFAIAPTVSVVIPVKNEEKNLPLVLRSVPEWVEDVVVVDGRSSDDTVAVARRCRPNVRIVTQPGRGKGDALRAGFRACTGDIVVMMDGDGSTPGGEITRFVAALVAGADYAKGSRFASSGGSGDITVGRRLGNRVLSGVVNLCFGTRYTDLCYGYNAIWSDCLPALDLDGGGFEIETVMNIRAAKAALRVQEVPSYERPRVHGESNLHLVADGWRIARAIAAEARQRRQSDAGYRRIRPSSRNAPATDTTTPRLVSVVICAHTEKRWHATLAAIESVRLQSHADTEIIVVVDHNPILFDALRRACPDVTVVENAEGRGLSGGKNTGVALARGDVVAFLDDDAVADSDWLKFMVDSYTDPDVLGVGGLTLPWWQSGRPPWFPREFDWVVGCTYRGMPEFRAPIRNVLGGNASFRREVFDVVGGFKHGLGRTTSGRPLGCEETEFCIRLSRSLPEAVVLFDPRAVISHQVPNERSRFGYFWSRCYAEGLSKAQVTASVGSRRGLSSERRYTTRTLPKGVARALRDAAAGDGTGAGRAGAIVGGLAATVGGYVAGSVGRLPRPRLAGPGGPTT